MITLQNFFIELVAIKRLELPYTFHLLLISLFIIEIDTLYKVCHSSSVGRALDVFCANGKLKNTGSIQDADLRPAEH